MSVHRWALLVCSLVVLLVVLTGKTRYTRGDSRYSLLVSQAILEYRTVKLNVYEDEVGLKQNNADLGWMVVYTGYQEGPPKTWNTHHYYPMGASLLSLPVVMVGRWLGMDMLYEEHDTQLQIFIAAMVMVLVFWQLYRMARLVLDEWASLAFGLALVFGTSLMSTNGVALWSHVYETLAIVTVLYWLMRARVRGEKLKARMGMWLGLLLFVIWLCRPTGAVFIVLVLGYLAWQERATLWRTMVVSGGLLVLWLLWNQYELGLWLHPYYDPTKWPEGKNFWENLLAMLWSPGRGLWVYMPALLLVWVGWALRGVRREPLFWLCWVWFVWHLVLVSRSHMPWGGWCYGPRFFVELVPGFGVLLLLVARHLEELPVWGSRWVIRAFAVLSVVGVYVHTVKGVYEPATFGWNGTPSVDDWWDEYRWDWGYPQFLATEKGNERKLREFELLEKVGTIAARLPEGSALLYGKPSAEVRGVFQSWSGRGRLKRVAAYNSLAAVERAGRSPFWFPKDWMGDVLASGKWAVDSAQAMPNLENFMKSYANRGIVLVVKDEGSNQLSKESRAYLRERGSKIDSLHFRESYLAVFDQDKLVYEEMGYETVEHTWKGGEGIPDVWVMSQGHPYGNNSSIKVKGKEYSVNGRGMNAVVLGPKRELIWATNFDTHARDAETRVVYRAVLKGSQ